MSEHTDVIVVGAGAAGLAAAHTLSLRGLKVLVLEARDRIGGRILTVQDPASRTPIDLGAEFLHGKPDVMFSTIRKASLGVREVSGDNWICKDGGLQKTADLIEMWDRISGDMKRVSETEQTFDSFIQTSRRSESTKDFARSYVEGFHAADPRKVSLQSLVLEKDASDRVHGERLFRLNEGYGALMQWYASNSSATLSLNAFVRAIHWVKGRVRVDFSKKGKRQRETLTARAVLVTVPVPLLQNASSSASIRFEPDIPHIRAAADRLEMGQVAKLSLIFFEKIWDPMMPNLALMLCPGSAFPTWWTSQSRQTNVITAWAGGPKAKTLLHLSPARLVETAIQVLSEVLNIPREHLQKGLRCQYFHDWSRDRFSLGAYSYTPVHSVAARSELAEPVHNTLFFAGEATCINGEHGTVHGALRSGLLAARRLQQVIKM